MEEEKRSGASPVYPVKRAIWSATARVQGASVKPSLEAPGRPQPPASAPPARIEEAANPVSPRLTVAPIAPWSASQRVGNNLYTASEFRRETVVPLKNRQETSCSASKAVPEPSAFAELPDIAGAVTNRALSENVDLAKRLHKMTLTDTLQSTSGSILLRGQELFKRSADPEAEEKGERGASLFRDDSEVPFDTLEDGGETLKSLKYNEPVDAVVQDYRRARAPESILNDPTTIGASVDGIDSGTSLSQVNDFLGVHGFLHCTPRYNVENVSRPNYYDLVVLEMPGNNPSGYVWKKKFGGSEDTFVLQPHQLLQLSLDGVVAAGEKDSHTGCREVELLSLRDLLQERDLVAKFHNLRFFSRFREARVFYAWHTIARSRRIKGSKRYLEEHALFTDRPVYDALVRIRAVSSELEDTNLFAFADQGGSNSVPDFIAAQYEYLDAMQVAIKLKIERLADYVTEQHAIVTGEAYLQEKLDKIKQTHPFLPAQNAGVDVDWAQVRSMQRCSARGHRKIEAALLIAQYMIEATLAKVLDHFWCRVHYLLRGIRSVSRNGEWSMDEAKLAPIFAGTADILHSSTHGNDEENTLVHHHTKQERLFRRIHRHHTHHHHHHRAHTESGQSMSVSQSWENEGSHLQIDVSLCLDFTPLSLNDMLMTTNSAKLRVRPMPMKNSFMNAVHGLCGRLGTFLEALPNLRRHRLISKEKTTAPNPADVEMEEMATNKSANYFSWLHMYPILNSTGGLEHALDFIHVCQTAYNDAGGLGTYFVRIQEAARRLWSLEPEALAQHLQRSIIMSKIREIMRDPESADDLKRSMMRDTNRLNEVRKAVEFLDNFGRTIADSYADVKHSSGLITSFKAVTNQLRDYICAVEHKLFTRIPFVFSTRIRNFTDFLKGLEANFELKALEFDESISIMQRLKNFECAREAFDLEVEVCESLYSMVEEYNESEKSVFNKARAGIVLMALQVGTSMGQGQGGAVAGKGKISFSFSQPMNPSFAGKSGSKPSFSKGALAAKDTSVHIQSLFQAYCDARERLATVMGKARNYLLAQLNSIKVAAFTRRKSLHERINAEFDAIATADNQEEAANSRLYALDKCGRRIAQLSQDVRAVSAAQTLLLEAHEIVGSATPVLLPLEVDQFKDMSHLEEFFAVKMTTLKSLVDVVAMKRKCLNSKIGSSDIWSMNANLNAHIKTLHDQSHKRAEAATLKLLAENIEDLKPRLETVTYLSSEFLRPRHWKWLSDKVFSKCDITLKFAGAMNEIVTVVDISHKEPVGMGTINRLPLNDLWQRGIENHLDAIRVVVAEAFMENMVEQTLEKVDETVRSLTVNLSSDWINSSLMREKVGYELNQITNLTQLGVTLSYCRKAVLILEHASSDMSISSFNERIEKAKYLLYRLERFVNNMHYIQTKWLSTFHFVKFSAKGELDKDTFRLYQISTEEMKKIELDFQTKQLKLLPTFETLMDGDKATNIVRSNLNVVIEDQHCNIQSLLDACPRLSLLSYSKVTSLSRIWLAAGAEKKIDYISECLHDMFDGVGKVSYVYVAKEKSYQITGFLSHDDIERVTFEKHLPFIGTSLEEFIESFETSLRRCLSAPTDAVMMNRVQTLGKMLKDFSTFKMKDSVEMLFALRMKLIGQQASEHHPNQSMALCSASIFAEDVWFCLGHPIGSLALAKPDFVKDAHLFIVDGHWRTLLELLLADCRDNISMLREVMRTENSKNVFKMRYKKCKALVAAIMMQEISFCRTLEELIAFKCLESASEHWAGRYQLHFLYDKDERLKHSPFDVGLGCVTIPYGLEYHGGFVRVLPDGQLEQVLEAVIGAATSSRASILINHDTNHVAWEAIGEHSVSCRDIASALGRVFSPLVSVQDAWAVKLFLARLMYLDGVGCVDFTSMDHSGLQILMGGLNACWSAVQREDVSIHDWLKFPFKTRLARTDKQLERSRSGVQSLREHLLRAKNANVFTGILVVGMASETFYTDVNVMNYATRSIFTTIAVPHSRPIEAIGLLFSCEGFTYAMEIQSVYVTTIKFLSTHYGKSRTFVRYLCSRQTVCELAERGGVALFARNLCGSNDEDVFTRLKAEFEVFSAVLWEIVLLMGENHGIPLANLRRDIFTNMQSRLDSVLPKGIFGSKRFLLEESAGSNTLQVHPEVTAQLRASARSLCLIADGDFIDNCTRLWNHTANPNICLAMISGETGCGKSSIRNTVIHAMQNGDISYARIRPHGGASVLHEFRAMMKVKDFAMRWLRRTRATHHLIESKAAKDDESDDGNDDDEDDDSDALSMMSEPQSTKMHLKVSTSVIYHASLSSAHFLGSFDEDGRWSDGILLRKLRGADDGHSEPSAFNLIVLDGPLGFYAEQVFSASTFCEMDPQVRNKEVKNSRLVFPSGELHNMSQNTMVLLETEDLSNASPALMVNMPHLHVSTGVEIVVSRMISVWCRSVVNWLGYYPPWSDTLDELMHIMQTSKFVPEILYFDFSSTEIKPAVAISRLSSFLRITEELLGRIHMLAAEQATFTVPQEEKDDDESEEEEDSKDEIGKWAKPERDFSAQVMSLHVKDREALTQRMCLVVSYAAIWGLGGCVAGSERRKFFDSVVRDAIDRHMRIPVDLTDECNIFDASINIQAIRFEHAYRIEDEHRQHVPKVFDHIQVGAFKKGHRIQFLNPSMKSVMNIMDILMCSGAHVLMLGPRGSGKTTLVLELLARLNEKNPAPEQVKSRLVSQLLAIVSKREQAMSADGMGAAILKLQEVMSALQVAAPLHDDDIDFSHAWELVLRKLTMERASATRNDFLNRTVYSTSTSLISSVAADDVRKWLERELATEVENVLESPGYCHAVAFVDDMHICSEELSAHDRRMVSNRPEALIKGLVDSTPAFGIKKSLRIPPEGANLGGRCDGAMERADGAVPVLHRPCSSDPRQRALVSDDFLLQSIGIVAAATGNFHKLTKSRSFCQPLKNFSFVGLPVLTSEEIHVCLVSGANASLQHVESSTKTLDLSGRLAELSRFVMATNSKMLSPYDSTNTSDLEKALRTLIVVDIGMASRFCSSLGLGAAVVRDNGSLLQLYVHEWRRYFLDPLSCGSQRDRLISLFCSNLDHVDPRDWSVSDNWMQNLISSFKESKESIWVNQNLLSSQRTAGEVLPSYRPFELNHLIVEQSQPMLLSDVTHSHEETAEELASSTVLARNPPRNPQESVAEAEEHDSEPNATPQDRVVEVNELSSDFLPQAILYPAAFSNLLKLIRVLSSMKSNILLSGFHGTTRPTALTLAGKICGFKLRNFDVKDSADFVDVNPSDRALTAFSFKKFLKSVVWQAAGFKKMRADENTHQDNKQQQQPQVTPQGSKAAPAPETRSSLLGFELVEADNVLFVVSGSQQLSQSDRRLLFRVIECGDPCFLFEDGELLKMSEALRLELSSTLNSSDPNEGPRAAEPEGLSSETQSEVIGTLTSEIPTDTETETQAVGEVGTVEDEMAAEAANAKLESFHEMAKRFSATLSGYSFQWVQRVLRAAVRENISVALDAEIPRAMELRLDTTHAVESAINPGRKRAPVPAVGALVEAKDLQARIEENLQSTYTRKRFSLLAGMGADNRRGSVTKAAQEAEPVDEEDEDTPKESSDGYEFPAPRIKPPLSLHGIFTCPVLAPMLCRKFQTIWYDIEGFEAVCGVCHAVMKPAHELHSSDVDANEIVLSFEPSAVSDPTFEVEEEQKQPSDGSQRGDKLNENSSVQQQNEEEEDEDAKVDDDSVSKATDQSQEHASVVSNTPAEPAIQISVQYEKKIARLYDFLGVFNSEGIFSTFKHVDNISSDPKHPQVFIDSALVEQETSVLIDEARAVLPHLLCLPSVSDALFLSEPVITMGPEKYSETASNIVTRIISSAVEVLLTRKNVLQTALSAIGESFDVIDSRAVMSKTLTNYANEIAKLVRQLSSQKQALTAELHHVQAEAQRSVSHESELMTREDCLSLMYQRQQTTDSAKESVDRCKDELLQVNPMEWQGLAAIFTSGPEREKVELMRAVMVVVSFSPLSAAAKKMYSPSKGKKKKKRNSIDSTANYAMANDMGIASITMDDDSVAQHGVGLLRAADFATQFTSVDPLSLSPTQLAAIKNVMAEVKQLEDEKERFAEEQRIQEGEFSSTTRPPAILTENPLPRLINAYIRNCISMCLVNMWLESSSETVERLQDESSSLAKINAETVMAKQKSLHMQNDLLSSQLHELDAALALDRTKLEALTRLDADVSDISSALESSATYIDAELHQIEDALGSIVADSCVAAAVLVKAGWLPEHTRQVYMEQLRRELHKHSIQVSDSPLVLGCMADRMLIRSWTSGRENSLPRDPASINARSLVHLSPMYSYIVDPEGTCASFLAEAIPSGFELCQVSALKFTLLQLEAWIHVAQEAQGCDAGLAIIISDAQAGLSDDLVAFLSAELFTKPKHVSPSRVAADDGINSVKGTADPAPPSRSSASHNWHSTVDSFDLIARLNPVDVEYSVMMQEASAGAHRQTAHALQHHKDDSGGPALRSTANRPLGHHHHHHDHRHMTLTLCRLRLYLVSTRAPTIDLEGQCRPLPSCCLKNMTVVQWPTSSLSSIHVEPQPIARILQKDPVAEHLLSTKCTTSLMREVSPSHAANLDTTNRAISRVVGRMYDVENRTINSLFYWATHDRASTLSPLFIEGIVSHSAAPLGVLISESKAKLLFYAQQDRRHLSLELDALQSYERELLAYQATISDVFTMSAEFVRTCGTFLPEEVLPPYTLSPGPLVAKCIAPAASAALKAGLLKHVPDSLAKVDKLLRGVCLVQLKRRNKPFPVYSRQTSIRGSGELRPFVVAEPSDDDSDAQRSLSQQRKFELRRSKELKHDSSAGSGSGSTSKLLGASSSRLRNSSSRLGREQSSPSQENFGSRNALHATSSSHHHSSRDAIALQAALGHSDFHFARPPRACGLPKKRRGKSALALCVLTQPLRMHFLRAVVDYVQRSVRPGGEWLVKLLLLLATWAQAEEGETKVPTAQLRTLFYFINESLGAQKPRFGHYISCKRDDVELRERMSALNPRKASQPHARRRSTVVSQMHNILRIPVLATSGSQEARKVHKTSAHMASLQAAVRSIRWLLHGAGWIDGLLVNRRSNRWEIAYVDDAVGSMKGATKALPHPADCTALDALMLDEHNAQIVPKGLSFCLPSGATGDAFECEWLSLLGVKLFSPAGAAAAVALGLPSTKRKSASSDARGSASSSASRRLSIPEVGAEGEEEGENAESEPASGAQPPARQSFLLGGKKSIVNVRERESPQVAIKARNSDLATLLVSIASRERFFLLGAHSALGVFRGLGEALRDDQRVDDFIAWKAQLAALQHVDFPRLDERGLVRLLSKVRPPSFDDDEDIDSDEEPEDDEDVYDDRLGDNRRVSSRYVKGRNLSVLESLVLAEAVEPGSSGYLAQFLFALFAAFLEVGGRTLCHADEILARKSKAGATLVSSKTPFSAAPSSMQGDDEDSQHSDGDDDVEDEAEDAWDKGEEHGEDSVDYIGFEPLDNPLFNSWDKLRDAISGAATRKGLKIAPELHPSLKAEGVVFARTTLRRRAFADWDASLAIVLPEETPLDKYVYMDELRRAVGGSSSSVFLASEQSASHMPVLSMHARDFSAIGNKSTTTVSCSPMTFEAIAEHGHAAAAVATAGAEAGGQGDHRLDGRQHRRVMLELHRAIRVALADNVAGREVKLILEMVDVSSPEGNALLASALPHVKQGIRLLSLDVTGAGVGGDELAGVGGGPGAAGVTPKVGSAHQESATSGSGSSHRLRKASFSTASGPPGPPGTPDNLSPGSLSTKKSVMSTGPSGLSSKSYLADDSAAQGYDGPSHRDTVVSRRAAADASTSSRKVEAIRAQHLLRMSTKVNAAFVAPNTSLPQSVFITAVWGGCSLGWGPQASLGDMRYAWLPRLFLPDIVDTRRVTGAGAGAGARSTGEIGQFSSMSGLPPGVDECSGILAEELDSTLLWIVSSVRVLERSAVSAHLKRKLQSATAIELRAVACVVVIWRIAGYVRSVTRERRGEPGLWSHCLRPPSLWQLSRLVVRAADLMSVRWPWGANKRALSLSMGVGLNESMQGRGSVSVNPGNASTLAPAGQDWSLLTEGWLLSHGAFLKAVSLCVEPLGLAVLNSHVVVHSVQGQGEGQGQAAVTSRPSRPNAAREGGGMLMSRRQSLMLVRKLSSAGPAQTPTSAASRSPSLPPKGTGTGAVAATTTAKPAGGDKAASTTSKSSRASLVGSGGAQSSSREQEAGRKASDFAVLVLPVGLGQGQGIGMAPSKEGGEGEGESGQRQGQGQGQGQGLEAQSTKSAASGSAVDNSTAGAPSPSPPAQASMPSYLRVRARGAPLSPLAAYRQQRGRQDQLAASARGLLNSMSSVSRFIETGAGAGGALVDVASVAATNPAVDATLASSSTPAASATTAPVTSTGTSIAPPSDKDESLAACRRVRAMTALFFAELAPQLRLHTKDEVARTSSFASSAGVSGAGGASSAGSAVAGGGGYAKPLHRKAATNKQSAEVSEDSTKMHLASLELSGSGEGFLQRAAHVNDNPSASFLATSESAAVTTADGAIIETVPTHSTPSPGPGGESFMETWPGVDPNHHDVHLGSLTPAETMLFMVRWCMREADVDKEG